MPRKENKLHVIRKEEKRRCFHHSMLSFLFKKQVYGSPSTRWCPWQSIWDVALSQENLTCYTSFTSYISYTTSYINTSLNFHNGKIIFVLSSRSNLKCGLDTLLRVYQCRNVNFNAKVICVKCDISIRFIAAGRIVICTCSWHLNYHNASASNVKICLLTKINLQCLLLHVEHGKWFRRPFMPFEIILWYILTWMQILEVESSAIKCN